MSRKKFSHGARCVVPDIGRSQFFIKELRPTQNIQNKVRDLSLNQLAARHEELAMRIVKISEIAKPLPDISKELFDEASQVASEALHLAILMSKYGREIVPSSEAFRNFRKEHANNGIAILTDQFEILEYNMKMFRLQFEGSHFPFKVRIDALFAMWNIVMEMTEFRCLIYERRRGHECRSTAPYVVNP